MTRRRAWAVVVGGLALLAAGGGGLVLPASAQEDSGGEGIGGFDATARAAATRQIFTPVNNIIPTENLIEMSIPYASATLSQGPLGHAVAAMAWPGDTFANACVAYPQGFPGPDDPNFDWYPEDGPRIPIPCYEQRAESFAPQGPAEDSNQDFPGALMETRAEDRVVSAVAEYAPQGVEGFSVAGESARSRAAVEEGVLVSEASSRVNDIVLGAGAIRIQGVVSTARATSDGAAAMVSGGTTVLGATVAGVPVTIDQNGVSLAEQSTGPLGQVFDPLAEVLAPLGITMQLSGPTTTVEGAEGEIATGGLIVTLDNAAYLANLPPEVTGQLPVDLTGKLTLVFGQTSARASATPGFGEFSDIGDVVDDVVDSGSAEVSGEILSDEGTLSAPVSGQVAATETATAQPAVSGRSLPSSTAVTLALVLLALIGSGLAAYGLHKLGTAAFEPVAATNCPLESG